MYLVLDSRMHFQNYPTDVSADEQNDIMYIHRGTVYNNKRMDTTQIF